MQRGRPTLKPNKASKWQIVAHRQRDSTHNGLNLQPYFRLRLSWFFSIDMTCVKLENRTNCVNTKYVKIRLKTLSNFKKFNRRGVAWVRMSETVLWNFFTVSYASIEFQTNITRSPLLLVISTLFVSFFVSLFLSLSCQHTNSQIKLIKIK